MTYDEIVSELEEIGLKSEFVKEFEQSVSKKLLSMFKETDKINSVGNLIRSLMKQYENESERWLFWQKVLFYFITPKFARVKNF